MQTRQYATESVVAASFISILPDYKAVMRSDVLIDAPAKQFDGTDLDFCQFLNLYDSFRRLTSVPSASCLQDMFGVLVVFRP